MDNTIAPQVRAAGGEVYAITSEPQRLADDARQTWALDFEAVGDPHQEISRACGDRGWLALHVAPTFEYVRRAVNWEPQHPKGYFQPGVLAVNHDGRVLYRWRSVPSRKTMGGAARRPAPWHVLERIKAALDLESGAPDAKHDEDPVLFRRAPPFAPFIIMLLANGWFVQVRPFVYSPGDPSLKRRLLAALLRLVVFVAAWVVAFVYLPVLPVLVTLAVWALWIQRERRYVHEQFTDGR